MSYRVKINGVKHSFYNNVFTYKVPKGGFTSKTSPKRAAKLAELKQELELYKTYTYYLYRGFNDQPFERIFTFDQLMACEYIIALPNLRADNKGQRPTPNILYNPDTFGFCMCGWHYGRPRIYPFADGPDGKFPVSKSPKHSQCCCVSKIAEFISWRLIRIVEVSPPVLEARTNSWKGRYRMEVV